VQEHHQGPRVAGAGWQSIAGAVRSLWQSLLFAGEGWGGIAYASRSPEEGVPVEGAG
jgi:hypothetical protein